MEETGEEDKGVPVALAARRPPPPVGSRLTIGLWRPSRRSCTRSASPRGNPNMFAMFSLAVRRLTGLEKLTYPFIIRFCFSNRFEKKILIILALLAPHLLLPTLLAPPPQVGCATAPPLGGPPHPPLAGRTACARGAPPASAAQGGIFGVLDFPSDRTFWGKS